MAGSMIGRTFNNRYELTERVGLGGMAEVYRAQDKVLGRTVAVKVMLPQYAADPTFTKRFRQEAASAANLQSPYIVNIYDWGLDGETYYIVMEFLKGTDLKTAIQERGVINQRKAAEIGSQIAQALSVAHEGGIIHRDIKPQNIMIQPDGNIKVMDFGIARAGDAGLSQTATVLGTAHYVSPEQAQGKELTGASDIYSLGVVLYEATTGKLPFDGQDAVSVAVKQVNEIPAPPRSINPNIDPNLEAIIMKALEKDPERRFANAAELRHTLNEFLAGRPVYLGDDISGLETQVLNPADGTKVMNPVNRTAADATKTSAMQHNYTADDKTPQKNNKKVIIGIIAAVVAIAVIAFAAIALSNSGDTTAVPDVSNKPIAEARAELEQAGFAIGTETEVYSSEVEAGNVVSTNPSAGEQVAKGTKINISVSKGTEEVEVPDLRGKSADDAQKTLANYGLVGEEGDKVYSDDYEEGKVAEQDTKAGTKAYKGDTIVFHLSKGTEQITIPNVEGKSLSDARSALENAGFSVATSKDYSDSVEEGAVISQSKTGSAPRGTKITLTISLGAKDTSVDVPYVVGESLESAAAELSNAGLRYDAGGATSGTVTAQSPSSGTVKEGSTIKLTVQSDSSSSKNGSATNG